LKLDTHWFIWPSSETFFTPDIVVFLNLGTLGFEEAVLEFIQFHNLYSCCSKKFWAVAEYLIQIGMLFCSFKVRIWNETSVLKSYLRPGVPPNIFILRREKVL
jgi:hypothetical protein